MSRRLLSIDQVEQLLSCCDPDLILCVLLAVYAGVRTNELPSVSYLQSEELLYIGGCKTGGRFVSAHPGLRRMFLGQPHPRSFEASGAKIHLRSAAHEAGLGRVTFHDLRQTFLSWIGSVAETTVDTEAVLRLPTIDLRLVLELRQLRKIERRPGVAAPMACIPSTMQLSDRCADPPNGFWRSP
jgi:integrase